MDQVLDILNYIQNKKGQVKLPRDGVEILEFEIDPKDKTRARALVFGKDQFAVVTVQMTDKPDLELHDRPLGWEKGQVYRGQILYTGLET